MIGKVVVDTDFKTFRLQLRRVKIDKIKPVVRLSHRKVMGMADIEKGIQGPRLDKIEVSQAFARVPLFRLASLDDVDLTGLKRLQAARPFRSLDLDRTVAEAKMRNRDRSGFFASVVKIVRTRA